MSVITEPSICIPRTLANVDRRQVKTVFEQLFGQGTIDRVDIVKSREQNSQFCRIFIHFRYWAVHVPDVSAIRDRLMGDETVKVVYENPWFWKCVKSRVEKPERNTANHLPYIIQSQASDEVSEDKASDEVSDEKVSDEKVSDEKVSDEVSDEKVSDEVSEEVSDEVSDEVSEKVSDEVSDEVSEEE